ncbi:GNAT family N-acetyltransferase [Vibrio gazogenes]|uniref:Acetyltransferase (GNAT) family protein n=1 Tax=Vibrio gazogenes DSM 21264 = NBRC 103151 TaxID=1123492 RepID=A0A1M4SK63_VIBGA|nr:GNAT family N-acetyltransferase [Vibrio gazogenes]USP15890.1 GNAT family N-acetyltransferase [Vibrio gazogenes]SHE32542.1 Acetyltransferase (GNAT) family protein [Vibrio gazogenes DSM 21264] [Vibrio gazogenes DSM 21264 = NBRC 103151]SJN57577.1 Acetyltransferase (GNAT) family protein [Vibrio gazogenes]
MIREITKSEFESFWPTFSSVIQAQETYAFDPNMTLEEAFVLWYEIPLQAYAFIENDVVLGTYYIKPNALGPSRHICNCGYMVSGAARGKGIARQMCEHSQQKALELGFNAMQFNSVVSTNEIAVRLWQKLGFTIIGTIPKAYQHAQLGFVDSYIMYKWLRT